MSLFARNGVLIATFIRKRVMRIKMPMSNPLCVNWEKGQGMYRGNRSKRFTLAEVHRLN